MGTKKKKKQVCVMMRFGYVFKIHTSIVGSVVDVNLERRVWSFWPLVIFMSKI